MTKKDRTNLSILIVLLFVLGLTLVLVYRMNQPPTATIAAVPTAGAAKPSANPPTANDARIRLDLVEKATDEGGIGKKNLFQYRQAPPPPPAPPRQGSIASALSLPAVNPPAQQVVRSTPPAPPPPPPITLKYQGFAKSSPDAMTAFLADDTRHFNVTVGEVLMGRFRIAGITDKSVDVEDLEYNRRQILPLVK
jgi:hypothetical protein